MKTWKLALRVVSIAVLLAGLLAVPGASASTSQPFSFKACNMAIIPDPSDPMAFTIVQKDFPDVGTNGKIGIEGITTVHQWITPLTPSGKTTVHLALDLDGDVYYDGKPVEMDHNLLSKAVGVGPFGALAGSCVSKDSRVHHIAKWWEDPEVGAWCGSQGYMPSGIRVVGEIHVDPAK